MYHHQAMREPDRNKFVEAMQKECTAHYKEGTYKLIKKNFTTLNGCHTQRADPWREIEDTAYSYFLLTTK
jgi:hypothetical protein